MFAILHKFLDLFKGKGISPKPVPVDKSTQLDIGKPRRKAVVGIIIHYISCLYSKPDNPYDLFEIIRILKEYNVSYDYIIDRDGRIHDILSPGLYSYHAGISQFEDGLTSKSSKGYPCLNEITIGIALVARPQDEYTKAQYKSLKKLTRELRAQHPNIKNKYIRGHEHVATDMKGKLGRKKDPGSSFDWSRYLS